MLSGGRPSVPTKSTRGLGACSHSVGSSSVARSLAMFSLVRLSSDELMVDRTSVGCTDDDVIVVGEFSVVSEGGDEVVAGGISVGGPSEGGSVLSSGTGSELELTIACVVGGFC